MRFIYLFVISVLCFAPAHAQSPATPPTEIRALWVTRGEYRNADDVKKIIANAASLNFNVILFQVRGNGTVFYKSKIEPWAFELTSSDPADTGKDPGWDPLQVAIDEAHVRGIELHAWINVFPAWKSQQFPPKESKQLWWSHPEWFMHDAAGDRMIPRDHRVNPKLQDWYSFISPGVPQVQDYLADVCEELVKNYAVDGLHFDYIRYPREIRELKKDATKEAKARANKMGNWSYDPVSLKRFTQETGVAWPEDNPEKWIQWRADQVTATVHKIAERVRLIRPKMIISAAVGADPVDAKNGKAQSYLEWLASGDVDGVFLMGYTKDTVKFEKQSKTMLAQRPQKGFVAAGVGLNGGPEVVVAEIDIARQLKMDGFAGFSYGGLFNPDKQHKRQPVADALITGPLADKSQMPWRVSKQP